MHTARHRSHSHLKTKTMRMLIEVRSSWKCLGWLAFPRVFSPFPRTWVNNGMCEQVEVTMVGVWHSLRSALRNTPNLRVCGRTPACRVSPEGERGFHQTQAVTLA